jgi:hypothetical protein
MDKYPSELFGELPFPSSFDELLPLLRHERAAAFA